MCACVTTTASMYPALKSSWRLSRSSLPCCKPQSTRIFFPPHSTQWQLPVTALAAPKKVSFNKAPPCFFASTLFYIQNRSV